jgi:prevent-host-death family protein
MPQVSVVEAKAHLSELLARIEAGEEFVITRRGRAVARLVGAEAVKRPIRSRAAFRATIPAPRTPGSAVVQTLREQSR